MPSVIGRGRYARATYPTSPGAGGAASILPLSRQRFIDGGTPAAGPGAADAPFKTIAAFMATRTNVSVADASANYVGWVMPAIGGYAEAVAFPPYASTELRADSFSGPGQSASVTGNVTWVNKAGAFASPNAAAVMYAIPVTGNITVTDDAGAPPSAFRSAGDVQGFTPLTGNFDASTTTKFTGVLFSNAAVTGNINAGSGFVGLAGSTVTGGGAIVGTRVQGVDTFFTVGSITASQPLTGVCTFQRCTFGPGVALTSPDVSRFDGLSWNNFIQGNGTRTAGTAVTVEGGYNAGIVEGAALTLAATSVSIQGKDPGTTVGFTGENCGNHYSTSSATPTSVTLLPLASQGDTMCISRTLIGGGSGALAVINGGPGAGTIGTIPALERGFVMARFDGTNWIFEEGGALAA